MRERRKDAYKKQKMHKKSLGKNQLKKSNQVINGVMNAYL